MCVGEGRMRAPSFRPRSWWAGVHPPESNCCFWRRELSCLEVIREERTVGWCLVDVGGVLSWTASYLILSAATLHDAVVAGGW